MSQDGHQLIDLSMAQEWLEEERALLDLPLPKERADCDRALPMIDMLSEFQKPLDSTHSSQKLYSDVAGCAPKQRCAVFPGCAGCAPNPNDILLNCYEDEQIKVKNWEQLFPDTQAALAETQRLGLNQEHENQRLGLYQRDMKVPYAVSPNQDVSVHQSGRFSPQDTPVTRVLIATLQVSPKEPADPTAWKPATMCEDGKDKVMKENAKDEVIEEPCRCPRCQKAQIQVNKELKAENDAKIQEKKAKKAAAQDKYTDLINRERKIRINAAKRQGSGSTTTTASSESQSP